MTTQLSTADRRLLNYVKERLVSYSPASRGGHLWERYDREAHLYRKVIGSRMASFVSLGLVQTPTPRASGTAVLTADGESALAAEES